MRTDLLTRGFKKNDNPKQKRMKRFFRYMNWLFGGTNGLTLLGGSFILQTLVYNFMYSGQAWMKDLWFVLIYVLTTVLLDKFKDLNSIMYAAFLISGVRLFYNTGILLRMWEYDAGQSNYYVLSAVVLIFLVTDENKFSKWLKLLLFSAYRWLKKSFYSVRFFFRSVLRRRLPVWRGWMERVKSFFMC